NSVGNALSLGSKTDDLSEQRECLLLRRKNWCLVCKEKETESQGEGNNDDPDESSSTTTTTTTSKPAPEAKATGHQRKKSPNEKMRQYRSPCRHLAKLCA